MKEVISRNFVFVVGVSAILVMWLTYLAAMVDASRRNADDRNPAAPAAECRCQCRKLFVPTHKPIDTGALPGR